MDTDLREAEKKVIEQFSDENVQRYGTLLMRAGETALEAHKKLLEIFSRASKALLLQELQHVTLPTAYFIVKDPNLEMLSDYVGHAVEMPGYHLGALYYTTEPTYLTSEGIFQFKSQRTRMVMEKNKIYNHEAREYPIWDSRKESPENYVRFAESAFEKIRGLRGLLPVRQDSFDEDDLPF